MSDDEWIHGGYVCPECKRNAQLAQEQEQSRREVERTSHLNEIKRKLLDLAIEGTEDRDAASQKVAILVRGSDFSENLNWFWPEVAANDLLLDVYFSEVLKPLATGSQNDASAVEFFDGLNYNARELVGQWLAAQPSGGRWDEAVSKYRDYSRVLGERAAERQRQADEYARRSAQEQGEQQAKQQQESEARQSREKRANFFGLLTAPLSSLIVLAGFVFGGSLKLQTWISQDNRIAVALFGFLGLFLVFAVFGISRNYVSNMFNKSTAYASYPIIGIQETSSIRTWLYVAAVALTLFLTWRSWNSLEGTARLLSIAAAFGVPLVPLLRGAVGSFALGIAAGLLSLLVAYIAGGVLTGVLGWVMKS